MDKDNNDYIDPISQDSLEGFRGLLQLEEPCQDTDDSELDEEAAGDDCQCRKEAAKAFKKALRFALPFVVNTVVYPLQLVATVMAVNGCG